MNIGNILQSTNDTLNFASEESIDFNTHAANEKDKENKKPITPQREPRSSPVSPVLPTPTPPPYSPSVVKKPDLPPPKKLFVATKSMGDEGKRARGKKRENMTQGCHTSLIP